MHRPFAILAVLVTLSACAPYQELRSPCVVAAVTDYDCDFTPINVADASAPSGLIPWDTRL